jgi:D-arabinose 1-dehydrogenase-like Zn-dependent alcohol dehydrogenase
MAEFVCVPAKNLIKVPGELPFAQIAVLGDAVGTSLRAVKTRAEVCDGQTVVISGIGGVGIHAVQIAHHLGGDVIALDVVPEKWTLARQYGASLALDARQNPETLIREYTGGRGADVALDFTGLPSALVTCAAALRPGGRLVMVGYQLNTHVQLPTQTVVLQELEVLGSRYCNKREMEEAAEWVASGAVTPVIGCTLPLEEANLALDMLRRSEGLGRIVLDLAL